MDIYAFKTHWNQKSFAFIAMIAVNAVFLGSYLLEVSDGFYYLLGQIFLLPFTGLILNRKAPRLEAFVDIKLLSFYFWYYYFAINVTGFYLTAIFFSTILLRIGVHSASLRGETIFLRCSLYFGPVIAFFLIAFDIQPWFEWPLPAEKELKFSSSVVFVLMLLFSFRTSEGYITTINQLEDKENELSVRYTQVLELNQILNHNIRTPLATAIGQLEIAKLKNKDNVHIEKSRQALEVVLEQTQSVNNAKKAFARSSNITEFFENWKTIYNYPMVELIVGKEVDSLIINEQSMIAIAVSLDIFTINSFEAEATNIQIHVSRNENQILIRHVDNGLGVSNEILEMFGKPINSQKGSGLGTYLAQRLLRSAGAINVQFANRTGHQGFEVSILL